MVDDDWVAETAAGPVRVKFAERNEFGVLDHYVITASGESIYNPLRVLGNGDGAEVVFTLYRREGMDTTASTPMRPRWTRTCTRSSDCSRPEPAPRRRAFPRTTRHGRADAPRPPTAVVIFPAGAGKRTYTESAGSDVRYALPTAELHLDKVSRNSLFGRRNDNRFTACPATPTFPAGMCAPPR